MKVRHVAVVFAVLVLTLAAIAQQPAQQTVSAYKTYSFVQPSAPPADRKAEVAFQKVADDVQSFFRANRISLATDVVRSTVPVPLKQVLENAKNAGAASVIYSTVELPGKAINVKTVAYALDGAQIWEANAGCELAERVPLDVCMKVTLETMHEALKYRISQQDLPVMAAEQKQQ
ncbi:MAG TPA: hypothetical protein VD837_14820 [Terriglobales bacterium]|nr:hypothetical protein [Terriglobales bacterium]